MNRYFLRCLICTIAGSSMTFDVNDVFMHQRHFTVLLAGTTTLTIIQTYSVVKSVVKDVSVNRGFSFTVPAVLLHKRTISSHHHNVRGLTCPDKDSRRPQVSILLINYLYFNTLIRFKQKSPFSRDTSCPSFKNYPSQKLASYKRLVIKQIYQYSILIFSAYYQRQIPYNNSKITLEHIIEY